MRDGVVGVVGAGTMGQGIAQLAALAGHETLLVDASESALVSAVARVGEQLARGVERGRWSDADAARAAELLRPAAEAELARCDVVVEAIVEDEAVKRALFSRLSREVVSDRCILATNTSSIPVTRVAADAAGPERVLGLHFFNPPPLMPLVEIVLGARTADDVADRAESFVRGLTREPVRVADAPGFLVNRCNRPFGGEALRLLDDGVATVEQVDRIVRGAGGFPMGPFQLQDFNGLDTSHAVQRSCWEQGFGEPRWRPSVRLARMVDAGTLGRKTGAGWYRYADGAGAPEDPAPTAAKPPSGEHVVVDGGLSIAAELTAAVRAAGWDVSDGVDRERAPWLVVDCTDGAGPRWPGVPVLTLCAGRSLAATRPDAATVGFHALPPFDAARTVELTGREQADAETVARAERFIASLGRAVEWVGDAPGLVLGRIVCQLVNEACFALGEGVAHEQDLDRAMTLGLRHPRGPLAWGELIGFDHVAAVLDGLRREVGDERYRVAPLLRRRATAARRPAVRV